MRQPRCRESFFSPGSGLTATGLPTSSSMGLSEYVVAVEKTGIQVDAQFLRRFSHVQNFAFAMR